MKQLLLALSLAILLGAGCSASDPAADRSVDVSRMSFEEYAAWRELSAFAASGGNLNRPGSDGSTPLTLAVRRRQAQTVRWLLDHGADVDSMAGLLTPLQIAVTNDDLEIAGLLLSRHAQIDPEGLQEMIRQSQEDFQKRVRDFAPEGVKVSEQFLWPDVPRLHPMKTALDRNHVEMVRLLLKHGGKIRLKEYSYGLTPLHEAVKRSRLELAKLLIEAGERLNEKSDAFFGEVTPLHMAARAGNLEMARLLVEKGADVNLRSADGLTALAVALEGPKESFGAKFAKEEADERYRAIASYLREHGAKE